MTYWYLAALGWAVCGFLAYGRFLAHLQSVFPQSSNSIAAFCLSIWGPISLLATVSICRHGSMWRLSPRKEG